MKDIVASQTSSHFHNKQIVTLIQFLDIHKTFHSNPKVGRESFFFFVYIYLKGEKGSFN